MLAGFRAQLLNIFPIASASQEINICPMVEFFQVFPIFSLPPVRGPCEALRYEDSGELGRASGIMESVLLMPRMRR